MSYDVCKGCEGIAAPVGEFCYAICTPTRDLVSQDHRVTRHPLDVGLDISSGLKDVLEVAGNMGGGVLSCCWFWGGASADGCLVVYKDLGGVCGCVVSNPLSDITGCVRVCKSSASYNSTCFPGFHFASKWW